MIISEEEFLKTELEMGISLDNPAFIGLANNTAQSVIGLDFRTVMDYGAGVGAYANAFWAWNKKVVIYEKFKPHREYIQKNLPHIEIVDEPITTDLMLFIEVAEHMNNEELDALFEKIKPTYILFSSTSQRTDWDEHWGHINVKEQSEWVTFFESKNYKLVREQSVPTTWSKVFKYADAE
jgi:2-polyprenyl-3-methyl-5-hydroxy-6-metoxy-1,4-benzoquinol methylase